MLPNNNVQLSIVKLMASDCYSIVWKKNEHWHFFEKMSMTENPLINRLFLNKLYEWSFHENFHR